MSQKKTTAEKIAALNNEYTKEQYVEFQKQQKQLIFRRRRLTVVFIIAFAVFAISGIQLMSDYHRLNDVEKQRKLVVAESAAIDNKVQQLQQEVSLLKDDDYVAKLARSKYYLSKEGEQVYTVPGTSGPTSSSEDQTVTEESKQSQTHATDSTKKSAE